MSKMHYEMDAWLGDDLLSAYPGYLMSEKMAEAIRSAGFTGIRFTEVVASKSRQLEHDKPELRLPSYRMIGLGGEPGLHDFASSTDGKRILVSPRALDVLKRHCLDHCEIEEVEVPGPSLLARLRAWINAFLGRR